MNKEDVEKALMQVEDPDLGIDIISLGLIYEINIKKDDVTILLTLTTPTCPYGDFIINEIEDALRTITNKKINIELTFNPPWSPDRLDPDIRAALNL